MQPTMPSVTDFLEEKIKPFPFEAARQAALELNWPKLQLILQNAHVDIDVYDDRFCDELITLVAATERDIEKSIKAVNFLIAHGADAASAIYGYAQGIKETGHPLMAVTLYLQEINKHSENPQEIVRLWNGLVMGFARGGHEAQVYDQLHAMSTKAVADVKNIIGSVTYNFVIGGHLKEFIRFREYVYSNYPDKASSVWSNAANGYGRTRSASEIEAFKLDAAAADPAYIPRVAVGLLRGYVKSKRQWEAEETLDMVRENHHEHINLALEAITKSICICGLVEEADAFLEKVHRQYNSYLPKVLTAIFNNFIEFKRLIEAVVILKKVIRDPKYADLKINISSIASNVICKFAARGDSLVVNAILALIESYPPIDYHHLLKSAAIGYAKGRHKRQAYELLSELLKKNVLVFMEAMKEVVQKEYEAGNCMDYEFLLRMLTEAPITKERLAAFFDELRPRIGMYHDPAQLIEKVMTYRQHIFKLGLSYEQVTMLNLEQMRFLLMHHAIPPGKKPRNQSPSFFQRLPNVHLHGVISFLLPAPLDLSSYLHLYGRFFVRRVNPAAFLQMKKLPEAQEQKSSKRVKRSSAERQ